MILEVPLIRRVDGNTTRPVEGQLVQWRGVPWKVGRLCWHPRLRLWIAVMEDGRVFEMLSGRWIDPRENSSEVPWREQVIGVDVERCPSHHRTEVQPNRRFRVKGPVTERRLYARKRRLAGATLREIGDELGISGQRVSDYLADLRPRWQ